jgi:hypothetical protein
MHPPRRPASRPLRRAAAAHGRRRSPPLLRLRAVGRALRGAGRGGGGPLPLPLRHGQEGASFRRLVTPRAPPYEGADCPQARRPAKTQIRKRPPRRNPAIYKWVGCQGRVSGPAPAQAARRGRGAPGARSGGRPRMRGAPRGPRRARRSARRRVAARAAPRGEGSICRRWRAKGRRPRIQLCVAEDAGSSLSGQLSRTGQQNPAPAGRPAAADGRECPRREAGATTARGALGCAGRHAQGNKTHAETRDAGPRRGAARAVCPPRKREWGAVTQRAGASAGRPVAKNARGAPLTRRAPSGGRWRRRARA